jgi:hypothetical protein
MVVSAGDWDYQSKRGDCCNSGGLTLSPEFGAEQVGIILQSSPRPFRVHNEKETPHEST